MTRHSLSLPSLFLLVLPACSSTGSDKGAATGKSVTHAADQIDLGITHLDATLLALKELVTKPAPDLAPQFKAFDKSLAQLESTAEDVAALAAGIDTRSQEYFAQWDQQLAAVQNEDIRARSAERREAISASFKKIQNEYSEVRDEFKPLLSDLRDVRTVLSADLTMDGLKAVEDTVDDIREESESVKESLQELAKKFHELGARLSRTGPPAEKPQEAKKK
jgi:methyl-accepting chemotaxis protein